MVFPVAVVIPTLNEEATVGAAVRSALEAGAAEVIVADGGSVDATIEKARDAGATIVSEKALRGARLNAAAHRTSSSILLFLHGDSALGRDSLRRVVRAIEEGVVFGGFRIRFAETHFMLRLTALLINLRTTWTRCPWGDQAQFIRRDQFFEAGGFREYPLMEDYELAVRMKRSGKTAVISDYVTTSGRRFLRHGFVRTAARNWRIILAYRFGADPVELGKRYRRG